MYTEERRISFRWHGFCINVIQVTGIIRLDLLSQAEIGTEHSNLEDYRTSLYTFLMMSKTCSSKWDYQLFRKSRELLAENCLLISSESIAHISLISHQEMYHIWYPTFYHLPLGKLLLLRLNFFLLILTFKNIFNCPCIISSKIIFQDDFHK